jgi:hypothetical protein
MWPEFFPKGCPPSDAVIKDVQVYRLVENDPPTKNDFLSHYEKYPKRREEFKRENNILAYGISVLKKREDVDRLKGIPFFKKKENLKVAIGHTDPKSGVIKETPSNSAQSHITFWLYEENSIKKEFKVI